MPLPKTLRKLVSCVVALATTQGRAFALPLVENVYRSTSSRTGRQCQRCGTGHRNLFGANIVLQTHSTSDDYPEIVLAHQHLKQQSQGAGGLWSALPWMAPPRSVRGPLSSGLWSSAQDGHDHRLGTTDGAPIHLCLLLDVREICFACGQAQLVEHDCSSAKRP